MKVEVNLCEDKLDLLSKLETLAKGKNNRCHNCCCQLNVSAAFDIWETCSKFCNGTLEDIEFWDNEIGVSFETMTQDRFDKIIERFCNN